ncbi:EcsC family protein [Shewanella xiamenensis]|uniref:EcsC family protein n=1 Tax=Shewanella xiamenensis TaxID=332186 RepID=UPI00313CBE0A
MKNSHNENTPALLKAVDLVIANPADIRDEALQLVDKFKKFHPNRSAEEIDKLAVDKIISNYSYYTAFLGGTTAVAGVIPGLGTALAVGGAATDAILCMKYQIEMTMAIATVYGHNILKEESKRFCYIIAGLGAISEAAKKRGAEIGKKAFLKLVQANLKGATLQAVKEIFKQVGITFTKRSLERAIPFGVGVVIGVAANKALTLYIGHKAAEMLTPYI